MNIPEGWPTPEMVMRGAETLHDLGIKFDDESSDTQQEIAEKVFLHMLAVAPTPPARKAHTDCSVVCLASQFDGITCPEDSCDIEDGVRSTTPPAAKDVSVKRYKIDIWHNSEYTNFHPEFIPDENGDVCKYAELPLYLPAHEGEPLVWIDPCSLQNALNDSVDEALRIIVVRNSSDCDIPLYTRPDTSKLRKIAERALNVIDTNMYQLDLGSDEKKIVEDLREALEEKS